MMTLTLIPALLFISSWISVAVCEFHTVEAQPGEEVTLLCSNFTKVPTHMIWFRVNSTTNISQISCMFSADDNATFYQNGTFDMRSNVTHLFLKIKQVELWDSGLYFCGFNSGGNHVILSGTYLKVEAEVFVRGNSLMNVILAAVIVFLSTVIIALVLICSRHDTAQTTKDLNRQQSEVDGSDDVNCTALLFSPGTNSRKRRPADNELKTNILYAVSK